MQLGRILADLLDPHPDDDEKVRRLRTRHVLRCRVFGDTASATSSDLANGDWESLKLN